MSADFDPPSDPMNNFTRDETRVALHIVAYGLSTRPHELTRSEKLQALRVAEELLDQGHDADQLCEAARYGMCQVWPFTEGRAWDARDFRKNVTKAKAAAAKLGRSGQMLTSPEEIAEVDDGG